MNTVGEVIETIKDIEQTRNALQEYSREAANENDVKKMNELSIAADMLDDYMIMLKKLKLEEEF